MRYKAQSGRVAFLLAGFGVGLAAYAGYNWYKFPMGLAQARAGSAINYIPDFADRPIVPLANLVHLAISPSAGVFWYCPPLLLCCFGLAAWYRREPALCRALLIATAVFVGFIACLTYAKGDPAWGPRYLTPVFSLLWLFAPAGVPGVGPRLAKIALVAGLVVQLLGLSIDPHRLYFESRLPSAFYYYDPWAHLNLRYAHLVNRPREVVEVLTGQVGMAAEQFSPAPQPTFGFLVMEDVYQDLPLGTPGRVIVGHYHVLNAWRPWWAAMTYLPLGHRPVDLAKTAGLLLALAALGLGMQVYGTHHKQ
jgi:hypothetical protein